MPKKGIEVKKKTDIERMEFSNDRERGRPIMTKEQKAMRSAGKTACLKWLFYYTMHPEADPFEDAKNLELPALQRSIAAYSVRLAMYGDLKDLEFTFKGFGLDFNSKDKGSGDTYIQYLAEISQKGDDE